MKRYAFIIGILAIFVFASVSFSQPAQRPAERRQMRAGNLPDLTEEQQAKMQELRLQLEKDTLPLKTKVQSLRADLKIAMTAETFDEGKANNLVYQIQKVQSEMQMKHLLHQRAVRDILTPEQRKVFDLHLLSGRGAGRFGGFGAWADNMRHRQGPPRARMGRGRN